MKKSSGIETLAALLWLISVGCGASTNVNNEVSRQVSDVATAPTVPAGAVPASFTEIPRARAHASAHKDSSRLVIRNAAAWEAFWGRVVAGVAPTPPTPSIDFARHMVLAAAMGLRPSGGYVIAIDAVYVSAGTVYAVVRSVSPGPNCGAAAVMTAPVAAVIVNRSDGPVRFVERQETVECG